VVARHQRSWGLRQKVESPEHRAEIVRRKRGGSASTGRDSTNPRTSAATPPPSSPCGPPPCHAASTRRTSKKRMRAKLKVIREDLHRQRHLSVPVQGQKVEAVVRGYFAYHAVPTNIRCLERFRTEVVRAWLHALRRRSQRSRTTWQRMKRLATRRVPTPRVLHPYPWDRFDERTRGRRCPPAGAGGCPGRRSQS